MPGLPPEEREKLLAIEAGECPAVVRAMGTLPVYCDLGGEHSEPTHRGFDAYLGTDIKWRDGWGDLS